MFAHQAQKSELIGTYSTKSDAIRVACATQAPFENMNLSIL